MGILVTLCGLWASVGLEICLAYVLASPSIDGKGAPSIDSPSSPRQFLLARQTDHSSLYTQKAPKDTKITTFLQIVPEPGIEFPYALCDTGPSVSILPKTIADHLGLKIEPSEDSFTFLDYSTRN
ncbi:hypothetical protein F2Q68_00005121 [Brassica cretica]|uniref:Uncharacterized protein n=2 Tax=Brassica cretica TaxID=69181 RepID=A0A3N6Q8H4_BRACR|nr:hypothetical protein F2Q68_00005121 [Brassica cretica]KAF3542845.1 hypothetical protein DY000_02007749 [Brassica cretica]